MLKSCTFWAIFLLRRKIFPAKRKIFPAKRKIFRLRRANIFLPSSVTLYFETKLTNFPHIQINGTAPDRSCTTLSFFCPYMAISLPYSRTSPNGTPAKWDSESRSLQIFSYYGCLTKWDIPQSDFDPGPMMSHLARL